MLMSAGICESADENFINYKEKTDKGQSGGPILVCKNGKYFAVGIHLAFGDSNFANHLTEGKLNII